MARPKKTLEAAEAMKLTSKDLLKLSIIDEIIDEPLGGAHRDKEKILENVKNSIRNNLEYFKNFEKDEVLSHRKNKFLSIGRDRGFLSNDNKLDKFLISKKINNRIIENFQKYKRVYFFVLLIFIATIGIITYYKDPQQCLYFFPELQGQGSFLPIFFDAIFSKFLLIFSLSFLSVFSTISRLIKTLIKSVLSF